MLVVVVVNCDVVLVNHQGVARRDDVSPWPTSI